MAEKTYELIDGVEGLVGTRVMDYEGQLCFEVEPQDPKYGRTAPDGANIPPILRIPIEDDSDEAIASARSSVAEGLEMFKASK